MLIEQIIEFELKGSGPRLYMYSYNWLFSFTAWILLKAMYVTFPFLGLITYKIYHQNARY